MDILNDHNKNIWPPFTPLKTDLPVLPIDRAKGVYLYTKDGRKILDAVSSWWVNIHGHSNPEIAEAIYEQAKKIDHIIFAGFTHEPAVQLSNNLLSILPDNQSKIFFSDNGSTAVEVGLKIALQYWHNQGITKKKVITIEGAYHGDTFGNMSLAGGGDFYRPFEEYLFKVEQIAFPSKEKEDEVIASFRTLVSKGDVACFVFEPLIQGSAGMRIYSPRVLEALLKLCVEFNVVTVADEVMTGFGRTGKMFATDHVSVDPDIFCLSKGLTGGVMAMSVTTCSKRIIEAFDTDDKSKTFYHGHSFTANPIACAVANKSFEILTRESTQASIKSLMESQQRGKKLLEQHEQIEEVEQLGTILRMSIKSANETSYFNNLRDRLYIAFLEKDILMRPLGNVIYVLPPYILKPEEADLIYKTISEVIDDL